MASNKDEDDGSHSLEPDNDAATPAAGDSSSDGGIKKKDRGTEAAKQLFCGGLAGSVAKTVTAPLSRLTILFQVHSLVTTKNHRPKFAMSISGGFQKIIERGGIISLWKGNMTSVLHRFPYSAINFYVYEHSMDLLSSYRRQQRYEEEYDDDEAHQTAGQLVRRLTNNNIHYQQNNGPSRLEETMYKFTAGAMAGVCAVTACYPLDLIRTRLSTELEGREHYRGIVDAMVKIYKSEGIGGFYAGIAPTLLVCILLCRMIL
jgi:solute carrier family 25 (mitochondrial phosphate transporter), member 23/24/25/41